MSCGVDDRDLAQTAGHRARPAEVHSSRNRPHRRGRHRPDRRRGSERGRVRRDVERLAKTWERISAASAQKTGRKANTPTLLYAEPTSPSASSAMCSTRTSPRSWSPVTRCGPRSVVTSRDVAPDLAPRMAKWTAEQDIFAAHRIDEQIAKALDRKVPALGRLVGDRQDRGDDRRRRQHRQSSWVRRQPRDSHQEQPRSR